MLTGRLFQAYDPYMTFCADAPGYERGVFRDEEPAFKEEHNERFRHVWHEGEEAYIAVAQALDKQPTAQDFKRLRIAIEELGSALAPLVMGAVDAGYLTLTDEYGVEMKAADGLCSVQALVAFVAIYIYEIAEGGEAVAPYMIQTDSGKILSLEIVFQAMAVITIDDYLIACLLASGEASAYRELKLYLHMAETIINAKRIAKAAARSTRSAQARKAARAKAERLYDRDGAILEWNINGSAYSSAAAFARQWHKDFNYTDPAHLARIIRKDGKKHPEKLK